jgi:hypothetical protein
MNIARPLGIFIFVTGQLLRSSERLQNEVQSLMDQNQLHHET